MGGTESREERPTDDQMAGSAAGSETTTPGQSLSESRPRSMSKKELKASQKEEKKLRKMESRKLKAESKRLKKQAKKASKKLKRSKSKEAGDGQPDLTSSSASQPQSSGNDRSTNIADSTAADSATSSQFATPSSSLAASTAATAAGNTRAEANAEAPRQMTRKTSQSKLVIVQPSTSSKEDERQPQEEQSRPSRTIEFAPARGPTTKQDEEAERAKREAEEKRQREEEEKRKLEEEEERRRLEEEEERRRLEEEEERRRLKAEEEERKRREEEERRLRAEEEERMRKEEEERKRKEEEERKRKEEEERMRKEEEERMRKEEEERMRKEEEERMRKEEEERMRKEAEERKRKEEEERMRKEEEERRLRAEEEERKRRVEEARARAEREAQANAEAEQKLLARNGSSLQEKTQEIKRLAAQALRRADEARQKQAAGGEADDVKPSGRKVSTRSEMPLTDKNESPLSKPASNKAASASTGAIDAGRPRTGSVLDKYQPQSPDKASDKGSSSVESSPESTRGRSGSVAERLKAMGGGLTHASSAPAFGPTTDDDEYEELDPRAIEAAKWVDKEIRKLIAELKRLGTPGPDGKPQIEFGPLFYETANTFEALSGTLKTAKKYKVVSYEGEVLYQGTSDKVVITLEKETHDGVEIKRRRKAQLKSGAGAKTRGFSASTLQTANAKCHICHKTVYPMEFVGASGNAFHKACFRCLVCKKILKPTDYCTINDKFYCPVHYNQLVMASANYTTVE